MKNQKTVKIVHSPKQRFWGIMALVALFGCGVMVGVGMNSDKVESVNILLPSKVKAGKDLTSTICLKTNTGTAEDHVFHIEVLDPAGKGRFHMKRNVTAVNGKYTLSFRMAHNDVKGKWLLKVTDAMTGMKAEKAFILE